MQVRISDRFAHLSSRQSIFCVCGRRQDLGVDCSMSIRQGVLVTEGGMRLHTDSPWLLVGSSQHLRPASSNMALQL